MADIKLYGYATSPYVRKVGCCLYYKQLPFEFVPVNPVDNSQINFTGQTQVPVLEIDGEWRLDSTSLAIWLDEIFPEQPLLGRNSGEREKILSVDQWVSESLIVSAFKTVYETPMNPRLRAMAWRMANIVSSQTPLSDEVRNAWPQLLQTASFIKHIVRCSDASESAKAMRDRVGFELFQNFGGGPYFGGRSEPSLLDIAIFPQIVFTYMVGIEDEPAIIQVPELREWLHRMAQYLPENPMLIEDFLVVNSLGQMTGETCVA